MLSKPIRYSICFLKFVIMLLHFFFFFRYVDQMPASLPKRGGPSKHKFVASYMVSYDLGSAMSSSGGQLLDVRVNANSLVQFSSVQNMEEFSRPSSLSFCMYLISHYKCTVIVTYLKNAHVFVSIFLFQYLKY